MAMRVLCIASSFAAASVVYKADQISRRDTGESKRYSPCSQCNDEKSKIQRAIERTREQIIRLKNEVGAPGIVVGVSVDGKIIWKEGIGFLDLENQVPANEDTVMRIASISKSLTAAVIGRLWQEGIIDIDQPIQKYVPSFPEKTFRDGKVTITTRQLMCHLSGIRHYSKLKKDDSLGAGDGQLGEFYGKERYESIEKALSIFKNDELLHPPGSKYLYSTYGFTLLSAVMEGATGKTYPQLIRAFLREMGMRRTYLDEPEPIIYGRSKCYGKNKNGRIINSPYVDNSCKWAGGGILSTVGDLLKFANSMLYAYQFGDAIDVSKSKQVVGAVKSKSTETFAVSQKKADDRKTISEGNSERDVLKLEGTKTDKYLNEVGENAASLSKNLGVETGNIDSSTGSRVLSKSEKVGDEVRGEDDASTSIIGEENKSSLTNIDRLKEAGGYAGAAVKYLGKGVSNTSRYVWKKVWPTSEKQEEKTVGEDDVSASGSGVVSAENENNQNTVSNVERLKDVGSHVTTATTYIGQGIANASSYVWGKVWSTTGNETKKGDKSVEKQSESSAIKNSWNSTVDYIWRRFSSSDEENKGKEVIDNEEESRSWSVYFKNIFRPKALEPFNVQDFDHGFRSNERNSFDEVPPGHEEISQGILLRKVIPTALGVLIGLSDQGTYYGKIIEENSGYLSGGKESKLMCHATNHSLRTTEKIVSKSFNRPYISQKTVASLWTRVESTKFSDWGPYVEGGYGLGFGVAPAVDSPGGVDDGGQPFIVGHTGGAVGASSALIIIPRGCGGNDPPKGVAVVIMTNLQSVSLNPLAIEIARLFANATQ